VVTITSAQDPELDQKAVCLGAVGLVTKNQPAEVLFQAIEKIHAGEAWIDRCMVARAHRELTRRSPDTDREASRIATLTGREREVMSLVVEGLKNRQIADRLSIAETTVRHHLTSIFEKLGVGDRLGLVVHVYRHRLVQPLR
jgi:two-component system nitrate/nitrite response regulator NarL